MFTRVLERMQLMSCQVLQLLLQVEWEIRDDESSGDCDDMCPWELHSPGCSVDDLLEPFKGSQPDVLNACKRLEVACSAVSNWVRPWL